MRIITIILALIAAPAWGQLIPTDAGWAFANGAEFPGARGSVSYNGPALRLNYDLACGSTRITGLSPATGCGQYVSAYRQFAPALALGAGVPTLAFDVRHPDSTSGGVGLRIVDGSGQTLQYNVTSRWIDSAGGGVRRAVVLSLIHI